MGKTIAEITSGGKKVAEFNETPNKEHDYEIVTADSPPEIDPIKTKVPDTKEYIRNSVQEFLQSIDHPESYSNLLVRMK